MANGGVKVPPACKAPPARPVHVVVYLQGVTITRTLSHALVTKALVQQDPSDLHNPPLAPYAARIIIEPQAELRILHDGQVGKAADPPEIDRSAKHGLVTKKQSSPPEGEGRKKITCSLSEFANPPHILVCA